MSCPICGQAERSCAECRQGYVPVKDRWLEVMPAAPTPPAGPRLEWGVAAVPGGLCAEWDCAAGRFAPRGPGLASAAAHRYAWFELTLSCTHRCRHCYLGERLGHGHAALAEITKALASAGEIGVQEIVLAGGEPTLHPQFLQILAEARAAAPLVRVLTNGWSQAAAIVQGLAQSGVRVEVPLLGWEDAHDWMTRTKGSFRRVTESLHLYRDAGVDLTLTTTLTRTGSAALPRLQELAGELGIPLQPSALQRLGTAVEFWEEIRPLDLEPALA